MTDNRSSPDIEDTCQCPKCGRMHRHMGFGRPPKSIMEQIANDIREGTFPKKSTGAEGETPCPGCDGHECDDGCRYPGVVIDADKRCPTCSMTDAGYSVYVKGWCRDPWHSDDHLRRKGTLRTSQPATPAGGEVYTEVCKNPTCPRGGMPVQIVGSAVEAMRDRNLASRSSAGIGEPFLWICIVPGKWEPENIRAWTRDPDRAAQLAEQGLDMKPLYAGVAQQALDRKGAAAAAEAICDYTDNNLSMVDACDMDTSMAQELYEAAKRLRDMLAPSLPSTTRATPSQSAPVPIMRDLTPEERAELREAEGK